MLLFLRKTLLLAPLAVTMFLVQAGNADASERAKKTMKGAAIGAGVGVLVDGSDGAKKGAVAGALVGNLKGRK